MGLSALATVIWVVALTVVGAAAGQRVAGPKGALIGAIFAALGSVLAGFVPVIVDSARRHREEQARLEQQAALAQEK